MKEVMILAARRTPVGGFGGGLSSKNAVELGSLAISAALESAGISPEQVDEVVFGNVLQAGLGQSPARQAAIGAKIPVTADATTVNKVCSSGLKATTIGAQQIQLGIAEIVVTGGMESMSNTPHYAFLRNGMRFGHAEMKDGMLLDGLWDPYFDFHMGNAAEMTVRKFNLSREAQDKFAMESYARAKKAMEKGCFTNEIVSVPVQTKKGTVIVEADEDVLKVIPEKVPMLKPSFEEEGTITAANASNLNDGAAALVLASADAAARMKLKPIAKILGFADAAHEPEAFATAPSKALPLALNRAGLTLDDIDLFELNEAYAAVILANQKLLGLDLNKVNIYGGAIAIGHPIGASGARILTTLVHALEQEGKRYGAAAICNGGGGATAIIIERL